MKHCQGCYNKPMDMDRFAKFWNVKTASQDEAVRRMKICKSCPHFLVAAYMCRKCGCYMPFKTKLKNMSCPEGHWVAEADQPVNKDTSGDSHGNQLRPPEEHDIK